MEHVHVTGPLLAWLGGCPALPGPVGYGYLEADGPGLSLAPDGDGRTVRYIAGGFRREQPYALTARVQPVSDAERLAADRTLEDAAAWAEGQKALPALEGARCLAVRGEGPVRLAQRRADGSEDRTIRLILTYEVI